MTARRRRARGESGLSLIEVLVTVVILGIAFVTVIGGMAVSIAGSDVHRKQATSQTVLRNLAEYLKAAPYDCTGQYAGLLEGFAAEVTEPSVRPVLDPSPPGASYTVEFVLPQSASPPVVSVYPAERWVEGTDAPAMFAPIFDATPGCDADKGLQRLTLRVRSEARPELCTAAPQAPGNSKPPCEELQVSKREA